MAFDVFAKVTNIISDATAKAQSLTSDAVVNKLAQSAVQLAKAKIKAGVPANQAIPQASSEVADAVGRITQPTPSILPWVIGGMAAAGIGLAWAVSRNR